VHDCNEEFDPFGGMRGSHDITIKEYILQ
jgi:hypothetical protein